MNKNLDEQLVKDFPNLYADRHADMSVTCMVWGFPGDGWHDLIRKASAIIESEILKMPEEERPKYKASQVKEKFGTLRFYMTQETPEMTAAIDEAEYASAHTCETCGKPGKLMGGSWIKCVCSEHAQNKTPLSGQMAERLIPPERKGDEAK